eukprot:scaffold2907_cov124-Skeletonema_dohrnii-CCMP3373.AAC.4
MPHQATYDVVATPREIRYGRQQRSLRPSQMPHQATYDVVATPIRPYDHTMLEPCQRCFYTIMANYNGALEAVDCHIHSVRYDMVLYHHYDDLCPSSLRRGIFQ